MSEKYKYTYLNCLALESRKFNVKRSQVSPSDPSAIIKDFFTTYMSLVWTKPE